MKSLVIFTAVTLLLAGCAKTATTSTNSFPAAPKPAATTKDVTMTQRTFPGILPADQRVKQQAVITLANGKQIVIELYGEDAPKAASNFIALAKDKFYDGLTFHRVEKGFVVQGGDPSGNGTGGPGYKFEDGPVTRDYTRGIVAMANAGPNTNGSQFFIMLADNTSLPKQYTIFGQVTKGMEAVDGIAVGDVMKTIEIEARP